MAILIAGLLLLSIIIYFLSVPVALSIEIPGDDSAGRNIRMAVFPFSFTFSGKPGKAARKQKPAKQARERVKKRKSRISAGRLFRLLIDEMDMLFELPLAVLRLVRGLVKSIRHPNLRVSLRGDFGEPDISGMLYGWSMALTPLLGDSASFFYKPNFAGEPLRAVVSGGFEFRLGTVLKELLIFIWRLPKLRMLKIFWRLKKGAGRAK